MNTIGDIISYLRKSKNITQLELSDYLGCSREFISQLERNKRSLPEYYFLPLSTILDYDIKSLSENIKQYANFEHYLLTLQLIDSINSRNTQYMQTLLQHDVVTNEFDYEKVKILKLYCTAVVEKSIYKDIPTSTEICLRILGLNELVDITDFKPAFNAEPRYYSTILLLGSNLDYYNEYNLSLTLFKTTIEFFEKFILNDSLPESATPFFYKKFYIILLNNYSDSLFILKDYESSLIFCNRALAFATKHNISYIMHYLLKLKVQLLYNLDYITEAIETYDDFKAICRITNNIIFFESSNNAFINTYPKLFL